jgi:butyryl-CoA dehydrogenase
VCYCARLVDEKHSGTVDAARTAGTLLEILTPIAKSWPSEWCVEANSLAIQVLGGYGYTRDYPVEQYWRDNRLNMIHEGTHGIHALDLLGRKVRMDGGAAFELLIARMEDTIRRASTVDPLSRHGAELAEALGQVRQATVAAWHTTDPEEALANATPYLQAFGHLVIAWLWLDAGIAAHAALEQAASEADADHLRGKLQCVRYFFDYELPRIGAWLSVVAARNPTCRETREEWFAS